MTGTKGTPDDAEFETEKSASAQLFDLRYLIGGLLSLYGLVLIVVGFLDSQAEVDKAAGIRINLWMGLGMLVVGLFFLAWGRLRPLKTEGPSALAQAEGAAERK
jgi:xanthine/uracil/vitamin C permease (AzgA family)